MPDTIDYSRCVYSSTISYNMRWLRGTNASRAVTNPSAIQQDSESCRSRGGRRGRGRGRGRPWQEKEECHKSTSILQQQFLGPLDVACSDCSVLHWEAENLIKALRVNPKSEKCCKSGKLSLLLWYWSNGASSKLLTEDTTEANHFCQAHGTLPSQT